MKARKGFTLIETLIVGCISAIVLGAAFSILIAFQGSLQTGSALLDIRQQATNGMDRMFEELYAAGQSTVNVDNPDKKVVTFQVPTIDGTTGTIHKADGTINWGDGINTDYEISYLVPTESDPNAGRLVRRVCYEGLCSDTVLANYISTVTFTGYNSTNNIDYSQPNSLVISITASKPAPRGGDPLQTELNSRVTFRNN